MPLAAFDGEHGWGYDGVALYAVHDAYGGPAALQRFVDAAHQRGLGVAWTSSTTTSGPSGNYLSMFGPYFTSRHSTPMGRRGQPRRSGLGTGPRLRPGQRACAGSATSAMDALRLDAVHALVDDSAVHVLAELAERTAALSAELGRPLSLIAESDLNLPAVVLPRSAGGLGMTAQWADDVHHALHTLITGERHGYYVDFGTLEVLEKAMTGVFVHDGDHSTFRGIPWGAPVPADVGGHSFVVFAQNHDQVGNRAIGDRPSRVLTDGQLAIEAAVILTSPFTPMLFMGEEWGARTPFQYFTDFSDAELGDAVGTGRVAEFASHGWDDLYGGRVDVPDPQARSTFEASRLRWAELDEPRHARMLDFHRALITLRGQVPDITSDDRSKTSMTYDRGGSGRGSWCTAAAPLSW